MATLAASLAFLAISRMLAPISSAPVATVVTFLLTCSAAAEATLACAAVSSALDAICWLTAVSCRDELASVWAISAMLETFWRRFVKNFDSPSPIWPIESAPLTWISRVRSPRLAALTTSRMPSTLVRRSSACRRSRSPASWILRSFSSFSVISSQVTIGPM